MGFLSDHAFSIITDETRRILITMKYFFFIELIFIDDEIVRKPFDTAKNFPFPVYDSKMIAIQKL